MFPGRLVLVDAPSLECEKLQVKEEEVWKWRMRAVVSL
jgi:hypothetical protein